MNPSYTLILSLWVGLDLKQLPLTKKTRFFLLVLSSYSTWIFLQPRVFSSEEGVYLQSIVCH